MTRAQKARLIELHEPHWQSTATWVAFTTAFVLLEGLLWWTCVAGPWWLLIPLVVVQAHLMHAHLIAFHEAAHRTLCPRPWVNDAVGVFIGNLGLMGFSLYRAAHHYHHAYLATERDEELWPFVQPSTPRWLRRLAAGLELTVGLVYTPLLFLRTFLRRGSPIRDRRARRRIWAELALMACFWAVVLAATAWFGAGKLLLVLYALPALLAGNLQSWRKYIEHMGLAGTTVLGTTRSVVPAGPLGRLVARSLFNVSYHGVHHQFARMPCAALPDMTSCLTPLVDCDTHPYGSYRDALVDVLRSLADPRVGPQWGPALADAIGQPRVRIGWTRGEFEPDKAEPPTGHAVPVAGG
jgi:fatty acid desaturase